MHTPPPGPIIEQDITRITHRDSPSDMVSAGRQLALCCVLHKTGVCWTRNTYAPSRRAACLPQTLQPPCHTPEPHTCKQNKHTTCRCARARTWSASCWRARCGGTCRTACWCTKTRPSCLKTRREQPPRTVAGAATAGGCRRRLQRRRCARCGRAAANAGCCCCGRLSDQGKGTVISSGVGGCRRWRRRAGWHAAVRHWPLLLSAHCTSFARGAFAAYCRMLFCITSAQLVACPSAVSFHKHRFSSKEDRPLLTFWWRAASCAQPLLVFGKPPALANLPRRRRCEAGAGRWRLAGTAHRTKCCWRARGGGKAEGERRGRGGL